MTKNSTNLLGCIADAVTGNYIMGESDIDGDEASQILYQSGIRDFNVNKHNTGKDVFLKAMPKEIQNMKLSKIDSETFGVEEGETIKRIDRDFDRRTAIDTLRNVFALGTIFLSRNGFTISASDLDVPSDVKNKTDDIIGKAESKTNIEAGMRNTFFSLNL